MSRHSDRISGLNHACLDDSCHVLLSQSLHYVPSQSSLYMFPSMSRNPVPVAPAPNQVSSNLYDLPEPSADSQPPLVTNQARHWLSKHQRVKQSSFKSDCLGKIVVQSILAYHQLISWPCYASKVCDHKRLSCQVKCLHQPLCCCLLEPSLSTQCPSQGLWPYLVS
jgi:hypothetical protein